MVMMVKKVRCQYLFGVDDDAAVVEYGTLGALDVREVDSAGRVLDQDGAVSDSQRIGYCRSY